MNQFMCERCGRVITRGDAVVRSSLFEQIGYHEECWEARVRLAVVPPVVPQQRRPAAQLHSVR